MCSEIFPTVIRAQAMSFNSNIAAIAGALSPFLIRLVSLESVFLKALG